MTDARKLSDVIAEGLYQHAGAFVPGGQAPVADLMQSAEVREILRHFHAEAKPTALLCHGPIAVVAAMDEAPAFYAGYRMTIFSASEEKVVEDQILHDKMFFDMPSALTAAGGKVETGADWEPHVVVDRELITGQSPRSDHAIAKALIDALEVHN